MLWLMIQMLLMLLLLLLLLPLYPIAVCRCRCCCRQGAESGMHSACAPNTECQQSGRERE